MIKRFACRVSMAAFVVVLGACAPLTRVVLLPQADGSASAVLVKTAKYEQLLSTPYQRVTAQADKELTLDATSAADVQKAYPLLYAAMPPSATKYVLYFMLGGTELTPESQTLLPKILDDVTNRRGADMVVIGHTDSTGELVANDILSLMRAKMVARLLADKGASASWVEAVGRGKRELLVPTADEVDEPQNRRVEIVVR